MGDTSADQIASVTFLENEDLLVGYFGSGIRYVIRVFLCILVGRFNSPL